MIAQLDAEEPDNQSSNEDADGPYHFIHLKDARVRDPQGTVITVPWWRGRLDAVDGFFLGTPT